MNINKIVLMGRLAADPELKTSASGIANLQFTLAINRRYKGEDGKYPTDFIRCSAFRQQAEFMAKYFKKGSLVIAFGNLQNRNFKDKDGNEVHTYVVVVDEVQFGSSKGDKSESKSAEQLQNEMFEMSDAEEQLPF